MFFDTLDYRDAQAAWILQASTSQPPRNCPKRFIVAITPLHSFLSPPPCSPPRGTTQATRGPPTNQHRCQPRAAGKRYKIQGMTRGRGTWRRRGQWGTEVQKAGRLHTSEVHDRLLFKRKPRGKTAPSLRGSEKHHARHQDYRHTSAKRIVKIQFFTAENCSFSSSGTCIEFSPCSNGYRSFGCPPPWSRGARHFSGSESIYATEASHESRLCRRRSGLPEDIALEVKDGRIALSVSLRQRPTSNRRTEDLRNRETHNHPSYRCRGSNCFMQGPGLRLARCTFHA